MLNAHLSIRSALSIAVIGAAGLPASVEEQLRMQYELEVAAHNDTIPRLLAEKTPQSPR